VLDVTDEFGSADSGDQAFTEHDLETILDALVAAAGDVEYGRYDLNGDGATGGDSTNPFNLNIDWPPTFTSLSYELLGTPVTLDEAELTDLKILCYYANSPLYTGNETQRDTLLGGALPPRH